MAPPICARTGKEHDIQHMKEERIERRLAAYSAGDGRAFDDIYEWTHKAAYFAILYIVRDRMHAEDILQETYLRALRSLSQYRKGSNFTAWLCTIARSLALNHLKKHRREVATDFSEEAYRFGAAEPEIPYLFELAARVLSEEEYNIVMLCQVSGYKRREVAHMMDMPIGTVTWKHNEALKKLKKNLKENEA